MNKIILSGNLVRNLDLKNTKDNKPVLETVIAVKRDFTDESDFITIQVWNKLAENLNKYCGKGSKILVNGELRTSNYKDKDNKNVYKTYVLVNEIEFLDGKPKAKEESKKETSVTNDMQVYEDFGKKITDEMLPF